MASSSIIRSNDKTARTGTLSLWCMPVGTLNKPHQCVLIKEINNIHTTATHAAAIRPLQWNNTTTYNLPGKGPLGSRIVDPARVTLIKDTKL